MAFLLRYMWFIFGAFVLLNSLFIPARAKTIAKTPEDRILIGNLLRKMSYFWAAPYFVTGVIQLLGGFPNGFYIFFGPLGNIFVLAAIVLWGLFLAITAYWVFFKGGAKTLIQSQLVRGIGANNELAVKVFFGIALLGGILALVCARFVFPPFPYETFGQY